MNTKIVNQLINLNDEYEKIFNNFAEKNDLSKVFEFECENYVQKLSDNIAPMIYEQLLSNPQDKLDFYLPYIKPKYHETLKDELKSIKSNDEKRIYNIGIKLVEEFNSEILLYKNLQENEKINFLDCFYNKNKDIFSDILEQDPAFFVKIISELRNPKIQYKLLNKNKDVSKKIFDYLHKVEKYEFEKVLKDSIFYPTDIEMDEYYNKWIGKDKIHVKFLKNALGDRYEYAKLFSKMAITGKKPKTMKLS